MIYADTDFFVALLKSDDRLAENAKRIYKRHKEEIWTSPVTLVELMLFCSKHGLDPEKVLINTMSLSNLGAKEVSVFLLAAHYMKEDHLNVFDSLHAAFCGSDRMVSSDKVFDRIGIERIRLEG